VNPTYDLPEERIMPTNSYLIAYDHAANEFAEIDARIQSLIHRKELLQRLIEPLSLLASETGSNTSPVYTAAYEQATNEIAEINAKVENLPRRKELLERLLESLKVLVSEFDFAEESDVAEVTATASNGSYANLSVPEAAEEESPDFPVNVPEAETSPFEHPAPMVLLEVEETGGHAETNGRSILSESQSTPSEGRSISNDDVAELAYRFWDERGRLHGYHEEDWRRAAHELQNSAY
jgi:hypothetical protein